MILTADLGCFDPAWRGWALHNGSLVSPEGWEISPGDALSLPLLRSQLAVYQAELRKLKDSELTDQPLPDAATTISRVIA